MNNINRKPADKNNQNNQNNKPKQEEVIDLEVKTESVQQRVSRTAHME